VDTIDSQNKPKDINLDKIINTNEQIDISNMTIDGYLSEEDVSIDVNPMIDLKIFKKIDFNIINSTEFVKYNNETFKIIFFKHPDTETENGFYLSGLYVLNNALQGAFFERRDLDLIAYQRSNNICEEGDYLMADLVQALRFKNFKISDITKQIWSKDYPKSNQKATFIISEDNAFTALKRLRDNGPLIKLNASEDKVTMEDNSF
jgi:hypothetical protein